MVDMADDANRNRCEAAFLEDALGHEFQSENDDREEKDE